MSTWEWLAFLYVAPLLLCWLVLVVEVRYGSMHKDAFDTGLTCSFIPLGNIFVLLILIGQFLVDRTQYWSLYNWIKNK